MGIVVSYQEFQILDKYKDYKHIVRDRDGTLVLYKDDVERAVSEGIWYPVNDFTDTVSYDADNNIIGYIELGQRDDIFPYIQWHTSEAFLVNVLISEYKLNMRQVWG